MGIDLIPVDHDPFDGASSITLTPVDHDPFNGPTINPSDKPMAFNAVSSSSRMPGTWSLAISSLPTDEMTRVKYLAGQRFPHLPINDALSKYGYKDGRLTYAGEDGKNYFEDPQLEWPTSRDALSQDAKFVASKVGSAMAPVASGIASMASLAEGPPGWATGIAQTSGAAAATDALRQWLANKLTGEEKPFWSARVPEAAGEAVSAGINQIAGNGLLKGFNFLGRTPTYNIPATTDLRGKAARFSIPLTPAEETGNRTLINRQRQLQNTAGPDEIFSQYYKDRNTAVQTAADDLFKQLDPNYIRNKYYPQYSASSSIDPSMGADGKITGSIVTPPSVAYASPRMGAQAGVEGAQSAIKRTQDALRAKAGPYYMQALAPGNVIPVRAIQDGLDPAEQTILQNSIRAARADKVLGPKLQGWQDNSMYVLDQAKKHNDALIAAAQQAGDGNRAGILTGVNRKLLGVMDDAFPVYGKARSIFQEGVKGRNAIESGMTGDVAHLQQNDMNAAPKMVFGANSSPEDIRIMKQGYTDPATGRVDPRWDALAGSYLRGVFEHVPETTSGGIPNIGGRFIRQVYNNPTQKKMLAAAFDHQPDFWENFNALADVLDATNAAAKGDSHTAFFQAGQDQLSREANQNAILPKLAIMLDPLEWMPRISKLLSIRNTDAYAAKQAEMFTTPQGLETLREMRKLGPKSAGSVMLATQFLLGGGEKAVEGGARRQPDGPLSYGGATPGRP